MTARTLTFHDHLTLEALYARFDAIAGGRAPGNSSTAHQAVLGRLAANRRLAEALGWTACALERKGRGGRLLSRGVPADGGDREVLPDWVPGQPRQPEVTPTAESDVAAPSPRPIVKKRFGARLLGLDVEIGAEARWLDEEGQ